MYIPDNITVRINHKTNGITVYSADEGHEADDAMTVAHVRLDWDQLAGFTAHVDYGSRIHAIGYSAPTIAGLDYDNARVHIEMAKE